MKKIFLSLVAIAALAACTKSEIAYDQTPEIGFAPAVKNVTKAAISGTYPDQPLMVFANYAGDQASETTVTADNINKFSTAFLNNAKFVKKTVTVGSTSVTAWGGEGTGGYSWPNNGSLVFAGYAAPVSGTVGTEQTYSFKDDELIIKGYSQSIDPTKTFDLAWFGRTSESYNYKSTPNKTVDVTLSHALAWIEIQVKGEGTTIATGNPWTIKNVTMNNVANTGDVSCVGSGVNKATWTKLGTADKSIVIFDGTKPLNTDGSADVIETTPAGTLVIPQTPTDVVAQNPVATLTVTYTYKSPASTADKVIWMPDQTTTVPLVVDGGWKSGYKYTYTLTFKSSEILVSPSYGAWIGADQTVTVQ